MKKSAYNFLITNKTNNSMLEYVYYLLQNKLDLNINEIAKHAYMSKSGVSRYFTQHGFDGFKEFKYLLLNENYSEPIYNSTSANIEKEIMINPIKVTANLNDDKDYEKAYKLLSNHQTNYILGVGGNHSVCFELKNRFERFGYKAEHNLDIHSFYVSICNSKKGDNLWVFSYTGETKEIIDIVKMAKLREVNVISITRNDDTTLSKLSELSFKIDNSEDIIRTLALKSRTAMLSIIIKLTLYVYNKNPEFYNELLLKNIYHK